MEKHPMDNNLEKARLLLHEKLMREDPTYRAGWKMATARLRAVLADLEIVDEDTVTNGNRNG
jgi:hypothetical protein